MQLIVIRNFRRLDIDSNQLLGNDLVLAANGCFYPVSYFSGLNCRVNMSPPNFGEVLVGFGIAALLTLGVIALIDVAGALLSPSVNDAPLLASTRAYIRERDDETCLYCGIWAVDGHVDHRISRKNGGGNEVENLAWACITCNCTKGAMNDYEFITAYELM